MNGETPESNSYVNAVHDAANAVLRSNAGSGATLDDPVRLGEISKLLAAGVETTFIAGVFGEKDRRWFDDGRKYHENGAICEQRIRLPIGLKPKLAKTQPGQVYSMFFDISELSDAAPVPDEVKQMYADAATKLQVTDTIFTSRFPLIEVRGRDAIEAARIIAAHLNQAKSQGWEVGPAVAFVEGWRNEYELTKGDQKTVMRFDMRPTLLGDSALNLTALTLIAANTNLENVIRRFAACKSWPEALAAEGLDFVDTSQQELSRNATSDAEPPEIAYDRNKGSFYLNSDVLKKDVGQGVRLVGKDWSFEMSRPDLAFLLTSAKGVLNWEGANHLFEIAQHIVSLKLRDEQMIRRSDAANLSIALEKFCEVQPDPNVPLVKFARELIPLVSKSGFCIRVRD